MDFEGKGCKMFGLDRRTFVGEMDILYREGDNNYSISVAIFDYNQKFSL